MGIVGSAGFHTSLEADSVSSLVVFVRLAVGGSFAGDEMVSLRSCTLYDPVVAD